MGGKAIKGFTLLELMSVLAVAAIILAFAVPSFREFTLNARMTSAANDFLIGLQLARSEAVKRQQVVALCATDNPRDATPACGARFTGWVVWADTDGDSIVDATETVLARHDPLDPGLVVTSNGTFVSYGPNGFAQRTVAGVPAATAALLCDERGDAASADTYRKRVITFARTGRPAILKSIQAVDDAGADAGVNLDVSCGPVG
jgi:type IV fimbrial biogenesis protein FimT